MVSEGGRLEIPSRDQLPGPDTATFEGLDSYIDLMRRCWAHNPEDRPSFQEIISEIRQLLSSTLGHGREQGAPSGVATRARSTDQIAQSQSPVSTSASSPGSRSQRSEESKLFSGTQFSSVSDKRTSSRDFMLRSFPTKAQQSESSPYASTLAETGSIIDPESLNSSWKTKLNSSKSGRNEG